MTDARKKTKNKKPHSKESYDSVLKKMLEAEDIHSMEEVFRIGDKINQRRKYSTEEVVKMCHEWSPKMRQRYPEPTVGALIFNDEGKIFLVKSHKWKGKYVIPGGHIELGETAEQALKREIKEETGLNISDIGFIQLQEFIFDKSFWKKRHFIFLDYACRATSKKVSLNSEAQEYVWTTVEKALKLPVEPYTKKVIEAYMRKKC